MKTRHMFILAALVGAALAGPPPLATGVPSFLDTNGDGVISEAERQAFVEARKEARGGAAPDWDSNGDGIIDDEERDAAVATLQALVDEKRAQLFSKVAGDDGKLTLAEFAALAPFVNVPPSTVELLFNLLDLNRDGEVTLDEFLLGIGGAVPTPPVDGPPSPPSPPSP